jgi:hypothetical protein
VAENNVKPDTETSVEDLYGKVNTNAAPGQSSASDWDMSRHKPSGGTPETADATTVPVGGKHDQQNPQLKQTGAKKMHD